MLLFLCPHSFSPDVIIHKRWTWSTAGKKDCNYTNLVLVSPIKPVIKLQPLFFYHRTRAYFITQNIQSEINRPENKLFLRLIHPLIHPFHTSFIPASPFSSFSSIQFFLLKHLTSKITVYQDMQFYNPELISSFSITAKRTK